MRYQAGRIESFAHHLDGFLHVVRIAAAGAYDVRVGVVYVVEVELRLEIRFGRASEEVQATVESEDRVSLFHDRSDRSEYEHVVVAFAAVQRFQFRCRIGHFAGVDVFQFDAVFSGFRGRIERCGAIQTRLVDIGHHDQLRFAVGAVDGVVDGGQPHRAHAGEYRHAAALFDLHRVFVRPGRDVVVRMHRADHARQRFGQRSGVISGAGIRQQATVFHHFVRDYHVGGVAADELVRIARSAQHADRPFFVIQRGLDREFVAGFELFAPLAAHFDQFPCEFVADNDRTLRDVARNAFVDVGLVGGFVRRHADAVAYDFGEYFVIFDLRQFEFLQSEVVFAVQSYSFCFHVFWF